jgi:hypothetical protein
MPWPLFICAEPAGALYVAAATKAAITKAHRKMRSLNTFGGEPLNLQFLGWPGVIANALDRKEKELRTVYPNLAVRFRQTFPLLRKDLLLHLQTLRITRCDG